MVKAKTTQRFLHQLSALLMLLALAWLTVCLPCVNEARQQQHALYSVNDVQPADDGGLPSGATEEKNESGASVFSDYLYEAPVLGHAIGTQPLFFKCHPSDLYIAYHPELLLPPPEALDLCCH